MNAQSPKSISAMIHHSIVVAKIFLPVTTKGMVCPSSSLFFCSPVLLVQKKDGSYHSCVDYHALNKNTMKNHFWVLRIKDFFDKFQGTSYFSRIDSKSWLDIGGLL